MQTKLQRREVVTKAIEEKKGAWAKRAAERSKSEGRLTDVLSDEN